MSSEQSFLMSICSSTFTGVGTDHSTFKKVDDVKRLTRSLLQTISESYRIEAAAFELIQQLSSRTMLRTSKFKIFNELKQPLNLLVNAGAEAWDWYLHTWQLKDLL